MYYVKQMQFAYLRMQVQLCTRRGPDRSDECSVGQHTSTSHTLSLLPPAHNDHFP